MSDPRALTPPTNNLAIAGFVVSLLGIFGSCGLLSPIGLILSLAALGREPRGFAIAGAIIGALGTCFICVATAIAIAVPALFIAIVAGLGIAGVMGPEFVDKVEMARIAGAIETYQQDHTMLPITLDDLAITDADLLTDRWGHPYGYELAADGQSYRLFSIGPDGQAGTPDDIAANPDWVIDADPSDWRSTTPASPTPVPADSTAPPANPAEPQ